MFRFYLLRGLKVKREPGEGPSILFSRSSLGRVRELFLGGLEREGRLLLEAFTLFDGLEVVQSPSGADGDAG